MRILANDGLDEVAIQHFESLGIKVATNHLEGQSLVQELRQSDVLIVRSATKVRRELLEQVKGSSLQLIIRAGVGLDNIDVQYAMENGFQVQNTPGASSNSVAELVLAHMFSLARFVGIANVTMRQGEWNKKAYEGIELAGKTLGIIGMGRIGHLLAIKAQALGMKVIYYNRTHRDDRFQYASMEELLTTSDFISVHIPKVDGPLLTKSEIDKMKQGVILINSARGNVIDETDLLDGLNSEKIAGAGIDVWWEEPTKNTALVNHPRVSCTPHVGGSTREAQGRIGEEIIQIVTGFFDNTEVQH